MLLGSFCDNTKVNRRIMVPCDMDGLMGGSCSHGGTLHMACACRGTFSHSRKPSKHASVLISLLIPHSNTAEIQSPRPLKRMMLIKENSENGVHTNTLPSIMSGETQPARLTEGIVLDRQWCLPDFNPRAAESAGIGGV